MTNWDAAAVAPIHASRAPKPSAGRATVRSAPPTRSEAAGPAAVMTMLRRRLYVRVVVIDVAEEGVAGSDDGSESEIESPEEKAQQWRIGSLDDGRPPGREEHR